MKNIAIRLMGIAALLLCLGSAHGVDLTLYVKPGGSKQASGMSEDAALGSVQVALDRALAQPIQEGGRRKIVILPGLYLEQVIVVKNLPDERALVISGMVRAGARPVFDGNGKGRSWLVLESASGKPSRLTVEGIEVVNYMTAISLNGQRTSMDASNSENVIQNNIFRNIGQISFPQGKPSTAALRLVNSRNNKIQKNQFINIRNIDGCGALHSIYIAHYSSQNIVQDNTFDGGCGATVKTRDASDFNIIRNNSFINQSEPLFLDSFCDKDAREGCTKESGECPSWGNEFKANSSALLGSKTRKMPVRTDHGGIPAGCRLPPAGSARVIESDNRFAP